MSVLCMRVIWDVIAQDRGGHFPRNNQMSVALNFETSACLFCACEDLLM